MLEFESSQFIEGLVGARGLEPRTSCSAAKRRCERPSSAIPLAQPRRSRRLALPDAAASRISCELICGLHQVAVLAGLVVEVRVGNLHGGHALE